MPTIEPYPRRGKRYWRARLWLGKHPATGKPKRKSVIITANTQGEAMVKARKLEDEARYAHENPGDTMTFAQAVDQWWTHPPKRLADSTRRTYRYQLDTQIIPVLGNVKLGALNRPKIYTWHRDLPDGITPKTRNRHLAVVKAVCRWAVDTGLIDTDPTAGITRLQEEETEVTIPTLADIAAVLDWMEPRRPEIAAIVWCAVATGMRRSELLALRWQDLEADTRTIHVRHALNPDRTLKPPKTKHRRSVKVNGYTWAVIETQRARQLAIVEQIGAEGIPMHDWHVWHSPVDGVDRPLDPNLVTRWLQKASTAAGVPRVWMHGCRHLSATIALTDKIDARSVAARLGHSSTAMTLGVYAHATAESGDAAADSVGRGMEPIERR